MLDRTYSYDGRVKGRRTKNRRPSSRGVATNMEAGARAEALHALLGKTGSLDSRMHSRCSCNWDGAFVGVGAG